MRPTGHGMNLSTSRGPDERVAPLMREVLQRQGNLDAIRYGLTVLQIGLASAASALAGALRSSFPLE